MYLNNLVLLILAKNNNKAVLKPQVLSTFTITYIRYCYNTE